MATKRRRRKKRATGRFYAFLATLTVLVVALCIVIPKMLSGGATVPDTVPAVSDQTTQEPVASDEETTIKTIDVLLESNPDLAPLEGTNKVQVDNLSVKEGLPSEWRNILLLGSDSRDMEKVARTDTIMIASINTTDGRVKLITLMRDIMVDIPGHNPNKINSVCYFGGVELAMKKINELFGMNITEYVMVNFQGFAEAVDILGGVDLDITELEMKNINSNMKTQFRSLGYSTQDYQANVLSKFGTATHLNGMQALGYARIRKLDSDFRRTERQRIVLNAILQKVKESANLAQIMKLASSVWGNVSTNISVGSAVGMATTLLQNGVGEIEDARIPANNTYVSTTRGGVSALYDVDFEKNADLLYSFIYEK